MCESLRAPFQLNVHKSYSIAHPSDVQQLHVMYRIFEPHSEEYVFVSGKNHIYQLRASDLTPIRIRVIGPKNFSILCIAENGLCDDCSHMDPSLLPIGYNKELCEPRLTDSFVKAWATSNVPDSELQKFSLSKHFISPSKVVINDDRVACENALYVCYSASHGFCERLLLTDINQTAPWTPTSSIMAQQDTGPVPVVGSDPTTLSALAIGARYVYVATESDRLREVTLIEQHPLSARLRNFHLADTQPGPESFLRLTVNSDFRIQYKLAFRYRSLTSSEIQELPPAHIYFILQQPETSPFFRWQPRMARICDDDQHFNSYVELHLACDDCSSPEYSHLVFNALHKAARGTASKALFQESSPRRSSTSDTEVIVVAFAGQLIDPPVYESDILQRDDRSSFSHLADNSVPISLNGSALAIFSVEEVANLFDRVILDCLRGNGRFGPAHFLSTRERENDRCMEDLSSENLPYYCPSRRTMNRFITGDRREDTIKAPAFLLLPQNVTDVAVTSVSEQFTVILVTTYDGQLRKYELESRNRSRYLDSIDLSGKPLTGISLDITGSVAFVTSLENVFRVELSNCSAHTTCSSCLEARDPYCGWCLVEGRCMLLHECRLSGAKRAGHTAEKPTHCELLKNPSTQYPPGPKFTWLAYTASKTKCPVVYRTVPPGMHSVHAATPASQAQHTVHLTLNGSIASDFDLLARSTGFVEHTKPFRKDIGEGNQLVCTFRSAPPSLSLTTDYLLPHVIHSTLLPLEPGSLLSSSSATVLSTSPHVVEIECTCPSAEHLSAIPDHEVSYPVIVWLEWLDASRPSFLAPALFAVYDCSRFADCRSCARSRFNCAWCIIEDRCVARTESVHICPSTSQYGVETAFIAMGQDSRCPRFQVDSAPLTLMSGSSMTVKFRVFNLHYPVKHFSCMEGCSGQRITAAYNAKESSVLCHLDKIELQSDLDKLKRNQSAVLASVFNCSLDLFWHGQDSRSVEGHKMVNEGDVKIEVYTCGWLADHCDSCLDLPPRFGCGWCSEDETVTGHSQPVSNTCSTKHQCLNGGANDATTKSVKWLQNDSLCPDPKINLIAPLNGTFDGQTRLHVVGRNLGWSVQDILGNVLLDLAEPLPCTVIPDSYVRARSFDCVLSPLTRRSHSVSGRLRVRVGRLQYQAFSPPFEFMIPQLTKVAPERGPVSGGTLLRLFGSNLNIGTARSVILSWSPENTVDVIRPNVPDSSIPCDIESESVNLIVCRTRPLPPSLANSLTSTRTSVPAPVSNAQATSTSNHLEMLVSLWNDKTLTKPKIPFTFFYSPDPQIHAIDGSGVLAGGGTTIRVHGEFLFVVEEPRLVFYFNHSMVSSPCLYLVATLECFSPTLVPNVLAASSQSDEGDHFDSGRFEPFPTNEPAAAHFAYTPHARHILSSSLSLTSTEFPFKVAYGFMMDGVTDSRVYGLINVHRDPEVIPFPDGVREEEFDHFDPSNLSKGLDASRVPRDLHVITTRSATKASQLLRLKGQFDALVADPYLAGADQFQVLLGEMHHCVLIDVHPNEIRCDLDQSVLVTEKLYPVTVQFGRSLIYHPGSVRFVKISQITLRNQIIIAVVVLIVFVVVLALIAFVIWRQFAWRQRDYQTRLDQKYAQHENRVIRIFKEDFIELQTSMLEFSQMVKKHNLPYRDYRTFCLFTLFPEYHSQLVVPLDPHSCSGNAPIGNASHKFPAPSNNSFVPPHPLLSPFSVPVEALDLTSKGISLFHALISNRTFLCLLVRVIDENTQVTAQDKSRVASLLSAILQPRMDYMTRVMCDLISESLQRLHKQGDNRLPTAFRRSETIADKFVSNWLTFLLHSFILNNVGENLFYLYRALLQQINMGPRDAVTGKARYTLDSSTLLQSELTGLPVSLTVEDPQKLFNIPGDSLSVKVLTCDTITQAKEKILDALYRNIPYSAQLKPIELDLVDLSKPGRFIMSDWDASCQPLACTENSPAKLNCVKDYGLADNSRVALLSRQSSTLKSIQPPSASLHHPSSTEKNKSFGDACSDCEDTATLVARCNTELNRSTLQPQAYSDVNSVYCLRPIGSPDPTVWYHLELPINPNITSATVDAQGLNPCAQMVTSGFFAEHTNRLRPSFRGIWARWRKRRFDSRHVPDDASTSNRPLLCSSPNSVQTVNTSSRSARLRKGVKHKARRSFTNGIKGKQDMINMNRLTNNLPKEVFFNRLMVTRLSVAAYVDKLFEVIFSSVIQSKSLPFPIKYLFDFLDTQALSLGVQDPKIVHTWKSNCLQMRFWNQIITNLDYVFDIPLVRNTAFERSFHALSQAMTHACAPTKEQLTPDSSSVKVLFAREIAQQWTRVNSYYREIKAIPAIKREEVQEMLQQHSTAHFNDFNISWALFELYTKYVTPCYESLVAQLQELAFTNAQSYKADTIACSLSTRRTSSSAFEVSDATNPIQLLHILSEVNHCLGNPTSLSIQTSIYSSHPSETVRSYRLPTDSCPPLPETMADPIEVLPQHSFFPSGDTTEYPDTLRSLRTLTTEFAFDELGQPQAHCYNLYGPNGTASRDSDPRHSGMTNAAPSSSFPPADA